MATAFGDDPPAGQSGNEKALGKPKSCRKPSTEPSASSARSSPPAATATTPASLGATRGIVGFDEEKKVCPQTRTVPSFITATAWLLPYGSAPADNAMAWG